MCKESISPLSPESFQDITGVSYNILEQLKQYVLIARQWQSRFNLLGVSTLQNIWQRHMLDAAQLKTLISLQTQTLVDFGSGTGFPGLVLAILGIPDVHLIESNSRKRTFLREVARITGTHITLHSTCAQISTLPVEIVTARAVAPLGKLLALTAPFFSSKETIGLFLKGKTVNTELSEARKCWDMIVEKIPSQSDPKGTILHISRLYRLQKKMER